MVFGLATGTTPSLDGPIGKLKGSWGWWTDGSLRAHGKVLIPTAVRLFLVVESEHACTGPRSLSVSKPRRCLLIPARSCPPPLPPSLVPTQILRQCSGIVVPVHMQ